MKSIKEAVNIINKESFELVEQTLPPHLFNEFMQAVRIKRKTTFRVNTIKADKAAVMQRFRELGISIAHFPLLQEGFIANNADDKTLLATDIAKEGLIYLQSISSQIPPIIVDPQPGEKILDLAAAPGSKTTQLAAMMANQGEIDAVEPDFIRKERLEFNIQLQGATNIRVHHSKGEVFTKDIEECYDRVLIDAPCSGEGRFTIYDKSSYASYRVNEIPKFHKLQVKLVSAALRAVKKGGVVVYSTCTLNTIENEAVLEEVSRVCEYQLAPIPDMFRRLPEACGIAKMIDGVSVRKDLVNALKIVPSQRMEGFFIAKLIKK